MIAWLGIKYYDGRLNTQYIANTAVWVMGMVAIWWLVFRWLSRRNFSKFPNLQHPIHYTFREADIFLKTETTEGILEWDTFQKAFETKEFFLLNQNEFMASPIIKSGFQNENDLERFRQLLYAKNLLPPVS